MRAHSHFDGSWIIPTHQIWKAFREVCQTLIISDLAAFPLKLMPRGSDLHRWQLIVAAAYVVNVVGIASTYLAALCSGSPVLNSPPGIPTAVWVKSGIPAAVLVDYGRTLFPLDSSGNPVGILYSSSI